MSKITITADSPVTEKLIIMIKNDNSDPFGGEGQSVKIILSFPSLILPASLLALKNDPSETLAGDGKPIEVGGGHDGWQVTPALEQDNSQAMSIDIHNNGDGAGAVLKPGDSLTVSVPVQPGKASQTHDLHCRVLAIRKSHGKMLPTQLLEKSLEIEVVPVNGMPVDSSPNEKIEFKADKYAPKPGTAVTLTWKTEGAESGKLYGALPHGNLLQLGSKGTHYNIAEGAINVRVMRDQVYVLEVDFGKGVKSSKMVVLSVMTGDDFGVLNVIPPYALPNSEVTAHWAVFGVESAEIFIDMPHEDGMQDQGEMLKLNRTGTTGFDYASGNYPFYVPHSIKPDSQIEVRLDLNSSDGPKPVRANPPLRILAWDSWPIILQSSTGQDETQFSLKDVPLALAFAGGSLALCTADGHLWLNENVVYKDTQHAKQFEFVPLYDSTGWLHVTTLDNEFAAIRRDEGGALELYQFNQKGQTIGTPVVLDTFQHCNWAHLVAYNGRVYVWGGNSDDPHWSPTPVSLRPGVDSAWCDEPALMVIQDEHLLALEAGLYALLPDRELLFFEQLEEVGEYGTLALPTRAAAQSDRPTFENAILVNVEGMLLALCDAQSNSSGIEGGQRIVDWVYNPQQVKNEEQGTANDRWRQCGHGLNLSRGVAAYRGDPSHRLWVIGANGGEVKGYTLFVHHPDQHLFDPDFFLGNPPYRPAQEYLDSEIALSLDNKLSVGLVRVDETLSNASLQGFVTSEWVISSIPDAIGIDQAGELKVRYSGTKPPTLTCRWMIESKAAASVRYLLELWLSPEGSRDAISWDLEQRIVRLDAQGVTTTIQQSSLPVGDSPIELKLQPPLSVVQRLWLYNTLLDPVTLAYSGRANRSLAPASLTNVDFSFADHDLPALVTRNGDPLAYFQLDFTQPPAISLAGHHSLVSVREYSNSQLTHKGGRLFSASTAESIRKLEPGESVQFAGIDIDVNISKEVIDYICIIGAEPAILDFDPQWKVNVNFWRNLYDRSQFTWQSYENSENGDELSAYDQDAIEIEPIDAQIDKQSMKVDSIDWESFSKRLHHNVNYQVSDIMFSEGFLNLPDSSSGIVDELQLGYLYSVVKIELYGKLGIQAEGITGVDVTIRVYGNKVLKNPKDGEPTPKEYDSWDKGWAWQQVWSNWSFDKFHELHIGDSEYRNDIRVEQSESYHIKRETVRIPDYEPVLTIEHDHFNHDSFLIKPYLKVLNFVLASDFSLDRWDLMFGSPEEREKHHTEMLPLLELLVTPVRELMDAEGKILILRGKTNSYWVTPFWFMNNR